MDYLNAFLCGGILCAIGQILIDKTPLTPARILTGYVVCGVLREGVERLFPRRAADILPLRHGRDRAEHKER